MTKLAYHIDDAKTACRFFANAFKTEFPDIELKQFLRGPELVESLLKSGDYPEVIFSDWNMPQMSGFDLLQYLKRHPKFHLIPVVMVTAESIDKDRDAALRAGALEYCIKPMSADALNAVYEKVKAQPLNHKELMELDVGFSDEVMDLIGEGIGLLPNFSKETGQELYRYLHTIKGGANSLQFPGMGAFVHNAEEFLSAVQKGNLYSLPQTKEVFTKVLSYLEGCAEAIKNKKAMPAPDKLLLDEIDGVKKNVAGGWIIHSDAPAGAGSPSQPVEAKGPDNSVVISRTKSSTRVANEALDKLQDHFKNILRHKVKLRSFAHELKSEFYDESFPDDLMGIIEQLNNSSLDIMDFFISLRVIPATRIKLFAERVVNQACTAVQKAAQLKFDTEEGLEIDQVVVEVLENSLTHLLRNSIDHGLEDEDVRKDSGKDPIGHLTLTIKKEGNDIVIAELKDDGGGINTDRLKKKVEEQSIFSQDHLAKMNQKQALGLIFVDGLSTAETVSDMSGRGVGLSAVKAKIEEMKGSIDVDSTVGEGTTFTIKMPRLFRL